ncbi:hypothetical protein M1615_01000 [Patescibacteria group bacterium]|nr:hypothetical protein [Patescibacteria group bacterium]MCL5010415.1 hypothetical protein [Patescibacteria group bacterium]
MSKELCEKSIMITGASGTGKSTLAKFFREYEGMERVPGHTTRSKRMGEFDGFDFIYINSEEEFLENYERGLYVDPNLQVTTYLEKHYGSPRKWITLVRGASSPIVFTPTSTITAKLIKDLRPNELLWIHLYANDKEKLIRLSLRDISQEEIIYRRTQGDSQGKNNNADINIDTGNILLSDIIALIRAKIR